MPEITRTSALTCPECGAQTEVEMPTNGCQFFWDCPTCGTTLRPEPGDCCVFCSYGSAPCPPVQRTSSPASSCCSD